MHSVVGASSSRHVLRLLSGETLGKLFTKQHSPNRRRDDVLVGIPAAVAAKQRNLPAVHQMDESRERHLQARRFKSRLQTLGRSQEQTGYELRDDGQSAEVKHSENSGRTHGYFFSRLQCPSVSLSA